MSAKRTYSKEPENRERFTQSFDDFYTRFARIYDAAVRTLPVWKTWLGKAVPHLRGRRVLEVSFGTGYLLSRYAGNFDAHGVDYNFAMVETARNNLNRAGLTATLQQGNVESLPYGDETFDTVLNTMAFSGYPDAAKAMSELRRVLKPDGRLVLIDVNYPRDANRIGTGMTNFWRMTGDLIRDLDALFRAFGFDHTDEEIGGWGSIHLYTATRSGRLPEGRSAIRPRA
jgi:ubiquinone/menaquinone biosynthesis C-methylase UbiE